MSSIDQATGQEASDKVNAYVNEPSQTGSAEAAIQNLVRRAYMASRYAHKTDTYDSWLIAGTLNGTADSATYGAVTANEIYEAAKHDYDQHPRLGPVGF